MSGPQAFRVMEDFANNLEIGTLKIELITALDQKHPFQNFKQIVESSEARQDWYDFKRAAYKDYVREEFEWQTRSLDDE